MWGEVTPAERLRSVTRRNVDDDRLAAAAADALAGFADEPASLVVACRRVLAHHRAHGALWWVCSRILAAPDPAAAARIAVRELEADRTGRPARCDAAAARRRRGRRRHRIHVDDRRCVDRALRCRCGRDPGRRRRSGGGATPPSQRSRRAGRRRMGSSARAHVAVGRLGNRHRSRASARSRGHR